MKQTFLLFLILAQLLRPAGAAADEQTAPLTLADCYALALKRSEEVAIRKELVAESEARFQQALSGALPRASFAASEKRQDGTGASAFTLRNVPERKFVFSQPLFSGFKEFIAMAGSRHERSQREHEVRRAEQLLLIDVAEAYYLVRQQREDLQALQTTREALNQRIQVLTERERLGRSRPSERASVRSRLRRIEAELEGAKQVEATAMHLLGFLTGTAPLPPLADAVEGLPPLEQEAAFLAKAGARSDVRAAEEAVQVAQKQIGVARAGYWPSVDLDSNYYTERVGASAPVEWDVTLSVDVPIFQGGQVRGEVRQAAAQARQAQWALERIRRSAALDIRDAYTGLTAAQAGHDALTQAQAAAEEDYRLQQEDYQLNLVNILYVLEALEDLQAVRRQVIAAQYDVHRRYWRLRVATGDTL